MRAFTFHEIVDGRLDAAVVALDVGHVFHRVGEDDAEQGERVDDCCRAAFGAVARDPRGKFHADAGVFSERKTAGVSAPDASSTAQKCSIRGRWNGPLNIFPFAR